LVVKVVRPSAVVVTVKLPGDDLGSGINSGGDTRLEEEVVVVRGEEDDDRGVAWWTAGAGGNCEEDAGGRLPSPPTAAAVAKLPDHHPRVQAGPACLTATAERTGGKTVATPARHINIFSL